ncbi:sporulation protein [Priestia koreensis]|uniref:Sporulation protein n=2 Tax=Priestia koreensis TaxID=284581 RepID=A0A0M0L8H5_9BACI|nr:sporulation protein [Priestia koreensis]
MEASQYMSRIELLEKIEETREFMVNLGLEEGFTSENTLLVSKFLDELLNKLDQISIIH